MTKTQAQQYAYSILYRATAQIIYGGDIFNAYTEESHQGVSTEHSPLKVSDITKRRETRLRQEVGVNIASKSKNGRILVASGTPNNTMLEEGRGVNTLRGEHEDHIVTLPILPISTIRAFRFEPSSLSNSLELLGQRMIFSHIVKWVSQPYSFSTTTKRIPTPTTNHIKLDKRRFTVLPRNGILDSIIFSFYYGCNPSLLSDSYKFSGFLRTMNIGKVAYKKFDQDTNSYLGLMEKILSNNRRFSANKFSYLGLSDATKELIDISEKRLRLGKFGNLIKDFTYTLKDEKILKDILIEGLRRSHDSLSGSKKKCLLVEISEFKKMSLNGMITIIDNLSAIDGKTLYVAMNEKQEVGKLGRRYNVLEQLPSDDRAFISNLKGYDMETAMQRIFVWLFSDLDLSFYRRYISNKRATRKELMKTTGLSMDEIKTKLTAIGMGQSVRGEASSILKTETTIYDERDIVFNGINRLATADTEVARYSRYRTRESRKKKTKNPNYSVTFSGMSDDDLKAFVFFYWTYYERKIQDVMSAYIKGPITLHDAVYTQCGELPDKQFLEEMIEVETGIPMKLGIA